MKLQKSAIQEKKNRIVVRRLRKAKHLEEYLASNSIQDPKHLARNYESTMENSLQAN